MLVTAISDEFYPRVSTLLHYCIIFYLLLICDFVMNK